MQVAQASKAAFCSALLFLSWAAQAGDNRIPLECKADSADELVGMDGKYEERIGRRPRFSASFGAAPSIGHRLEDVLRTMVDGQLVGVMQLLVQVNGDIAGDLDFDTSIDRDDADTSVSFAVNWPGVRAASIVQVGTLGCSLQHR